MVKRVFKWFSTLGKRDRVPKIVWMYWNQGWDKAPELVSACAESWKIQNPGWKIRLLAEADVQRILHDDPGLVAVANKQLPLDAYSNLVRLALLIRHGGVWADATTYCLKPLDSWLPNALPSGFFGFERPGPDRMLSSWFLAAERGCELLEIWQEYCSDYWSVRDERHTHFWFHGTLFARAYEESSKFRDIWDRTLKISADGPHSLLPHRETLHLPFGRADTDRLIAAGVPLLKLTHKVTRPDWPHDSAYAYFVSRENHAVARTR